MSPVGILHWTRMVGTAGQFGYRVEVLYRSGGSTTAEFVGTAYGVPGPVLMRTVSTGAEVWVDDPGRFGSRFGRDWVRRFYGLTVPGHQVTA